MKYQCTTTSDSMLDSFFVQAIRDPADASGVLAGVNPMMIVVRSMVDIRYATLTVSWSRSDSSFISLACCGEMTSFAYGFRDVMSILIR